MSRVTQQRKLILTQIQIYDHMWELERRSTGLSKALPSGPSYAPTTCLKFVNDNIKLCLVWYLIPQATIILLKAFIRPNPACSV